MLQPMRAVIQIGYKFTRSFSSSATVQYSTVWHCLQHPIPDSWAVLVLLTAM